jgi:orotate phosphoribosyltransferase
MAEGRAQETGTSPERLLRDAGAMLDGHFQLASGRHSSVYVEKFRLLEQPGQTEALCRMIAEWARPFGPQLVAGPTTGGIIISYELARLLGVRGIFAESADDGREFARGFTIAPGERVLVVDDVLTTGGSVRDVLDAVRALGGEIAGVAVLIDRTGGEADFGVPFFACLTLDLDTHEPGQCPLCADGVPLTIT